MQRLFGLTSHALSRGLSARLALRTPRRLLRRAPAVAVTAIAFSLALVGGRGAVAAATIRVPADHPTIQAAINAAQSGDVVLVSPGIYREQLTITGKSITLASEFHTTGDPGRIATTIIEGPAGPNAITISATSIPQVTIVGFTLTNVSGQEIDGIRSFAPAEILNNHIIGFDDSLDLQPPFTQPASFVIRNNRIENSTDDAIDFDGPSSALVENNILHNGRDDGIEMRLHDFAGRLDITFRGNTITSNNSDGIQLIDEAGASDRHFTIERNLFASNRKAGLGLMDSGQTTEDYRAASLLDEIRLFNNTFVNHNHSVSGGDNLVAVNNLFVSSSVIGLKGVDGNSIAAHNLFWGNGTNAVSSNLDAATTIVADPLLAADYTLRIGSPAIDTGTASYTWQGTTVLSMPVGTYSGAAPDLGAYERTTTGTQLETTITSSPPNATNSTSATFAFAATVANSTFACALDGGVYVACTSPTTYTGLTQGTHIFSVRATDPTGTTDATPATRTWTVDTSPPETTITQAPIDPSGSAWASFSFVSSEVGSTLACSLDSGAFTACTSPKTYDNLGNAMHTFDVRATDAAGNVDPTPARHTWTVQAIGQTVTFAAEADARVEGASPTANFGSATALGADLSPSKESYARFTVTGVTGTVTNARFRIFAYSGTVNGPALYLTGNTWSEAAITWDTRPARTSGSIGDKGSVVANTWVEYDVTAVVSGNGTYSFDLGATSSDGVDFNAREATTNKPELVVTSSTAGGGDTTPPETTIVSGPSGTVNTATAQFTFSASESGSTFACRLDGSAYAACASPQNYTGLSDGAHTFELRATDAAGNTDPSPASRTWTVDTAAPTVTGVVPVEGATDVPVNTTLSATFSESMDAASISTTTYRLVRTSDLAVVPALVSYDSTARRASLDPTGDLDPATSYAATVTTGARDSAGNPLAADKVWSFSTAAGPPPLPTGIRRESVSTTVNSTAATTAVVTRPSGTGAGDVLVACVALNGGKVTSTGVPAGWAPIAAITAISNPHVFGYYKVAGASEPTSYTWSLSASVQSGAGVGRYSGVNTTAPLDTAASTATGAAATSATVPGVTTVSADALLVGCIGINSSIVGTTITSPAGMTEAWDIGGKRHELADGPQAAAGTSGNKTWTFSASRAWAGWLVALRPR